MSLDRIIRWQGRKPTAEEVKTVIEDFFNGQATIAWEKDRYIVVMPGVCKSPLLRISPVYQNATQEVIMLRWLEVWEDTERTCLYVMTRRQDEYVNSIAAGLAEVFRRYWNGNLES